MSQRPTVQVPDWIDQAKQALSTISQTGRLALAEMRRLLGLLRSSDDSGGEGGEKGAAVHG